MATLFLKPNLKIRASGLTLTRIFLKSMPVVYHLLRSKSLPREQQGRALQNSAFALARALQVKLEIQGLEHLPREPCVIAPLHEGLLDVLALLHLPLTMRFATRGELFEWQWIGQVIKAMHSIEVNPEQGTTSYRRLLQAAKEVFARGEHLVLFPQGSICGIETAFQKGAFALAKTFDVPILPVVLSGSHRIWDHPFSPDLHTKQTMLMQVFEPIRNPDRLALQRQMKALALATSRRYDPKRDGYWDGYVFDIDPDFPKVYQQILLHRQEAGFQANGSAS
jgi:1-acyl-sn-glycerol-3-phosphate acyltransferase